MAEACVQNWVQTSFVNRVIKMKSSVAYMPGLSRATSGGRNRQTCREEFVANERNALQPVSEVPKISFTHHSDILEDAVRVQLRLIA